MLQRCGFGEAAVLALPAAPWGVLASQTLMLARAGDAPAGVETLPHWLLLPDRQGVAEQLAARHAARGGTCTRVAPGQDVAAALAVCEGALELVRALVEAGRPLRRLWFAARGATGEAAPAPAGQAVAQAVLWGLARVAGAEHPELRVTRADLEAAVVADAPADAVRLWAELTQPAAEDELRWRGGERQVARQADPAAAPGTVAFRPDASYLITGGLGALGLLTAHWMAERGARTLVLAGRSAPGAQAQAALDALRAEGVRVVVQQADVARAADVARLLGHVATQLPPLRGVVHAAGVLEDGTLRQLDAARFHSLLTPAAPRCCRARVACVAGLAANAWRSRRRVVLRVFTRAFDARWHGMTCREAQSRAGRGAADPTGLRR